MNLLEELKKNPFVLAPMAGITDSPFRRYMRELGCGPVISELVSATGLVYGQEKTLKLIQLGGQQSPVGVQIFGEGPEVLRDAAQIVEQLGADFIDLNFGCPVPKVVKKGGGSAVLKDLVQLRKILRAVRSGISIPLTIKIRTGWTEATRNSAEVVQVAYDEGVTWVGIHGRSRAQGYAGEANWDYITEVKSQSAVPILGNGDIHSGNQANQRLMESQCDGVMIGRGCLRDPWIFLEAMEIYKHRKETAACQQKKEEPREGSNSRSEGIPRSPSLIDRSPERYLKLFEQMRVLFEPHYSERIFILQTRKLAVWYSSGFPGSAQFRRDLFAITDRKALLGRIDQYFRAMGNLGRKTKDVHQGFLLGGHG